MNDECRIYNPGDYPLRVKKYDDGTCRWSFQQDSRQNALLFQINIGLFTGIGLIGGVIFSQMSFLHGLGFFAASIGIGLLIYGLVRWMERINPFLSYEMNSEMIRVYPLAKGREGGYRFKDAKNVTVYPECSEIRLHYGIQTVRIYTLPEDFDFVKDFILKKIPEIPIEIR